MVRGRFSSCEEREKTPGQAVVLMLEVLISSKCNVREAVTLCNHSRTRRLMMSHKTSFLSSEHFTMDPMPWDLSARCEERV